LGNALPRAAWMAALISSSNGLLFQAQTVTIGLVQAFLASLGVDSKKLIHLGHDLNRGGIFGIEFNRIEELSPGMRLMWSST
jgi:hypothetical protein